MELSTLKDYLSQIHSISDDVMEAYLAEWHPYVAPRKTILTSEGDTERYMYFVLEGVQRSYYITDDKEHVMAFTYAPSFSGIPESFLTQTPSPYFLETITESSFVRISFEAHQRLMLEHRPIETLFRKATEMLLIGVMQRHYELMSQDITTRFTSFAQRSAHLINLVPHKDIASYLRIDPSNFSKLLNTVKY